MGFRLSYVIAEAYRGFRRNLLLASSMIVIVAISLTLLGIALLAQEQVSRIGSYWGDRVEVSVFLQEGISPQQRSAIEQELRGIDVVQEVYYESKEQAYQRFKEQFKDSPDLVATVDPSALPESFRVKLRDPDKVEIVHDELCSGQVDARGRERCDPGIDQVIDQKQLVERLFTLINYVRVGFLSLALMLGAAAVVLIAVTVRVAAFARRRETQIMKLVGASNTYIRLPFLLEGVVAGILGSFIAFGLLGTGMYFLGRIRNQVSLFQNLQIVGPSEFYETCVRLLILGVVASGVASILALRKYVRV